MSASFCAASTRNATRSGKVYYIPRLGVGHNVPSALKCKGGRAIRHDGPILTSRVAGTEYADCTAGPHIVDPTSARVREVRVASSAQHPHLSVVGSHVYQEQVAEAIKGGLKIAERRR